MVLGHLSSNFMETQPATMGFLRRVHDFPNFTMTFPLTGGWRAFEMPFMIVMCPGFHDHYASISAENRELDQESRLSLIGPKIQHKTCSHSIYAWEIRNWHCGACGALGGAFPLSPPGHPVTQLSPKRREATGDLRRYGAQWVSTMKRGASWGY